MDESTASAFAPEQRIAADSRLDPFVKGRKVFASSQTRMFILARAASGFGGIAGA
jgi:hypothetical protein